MNKAKEIHIEGLVQGVGFRPFIYRLAHEFDLRGSVENNNLGVKIIIEGKESSLHDFIDHIIPRSPMASSIEDIKVSDIELTGFTEFSIAKSTSVSDEITEVSPDIAVCSDCLDDMKNQSRRITYPFTNCTNCGPRFTIIKDLPYDRKKTTMKVFKMCQACNIEYTTILNRRFHAQPIACEICGPKYTLHLNNKRITDINEILNRSTDLLENGKILAIKGLGGYHLSCNAFNEKAISKLRENKSREGKPFALMFADIKAAEEYLHIEDLEKELLTSWRKPVTILKIKKDIAPSVSIYLDTAGVMLPYMPFHYMLFEMLKTPAIVLTSGNISDEPIVIDNKEALKKLGAISDAVITYNRDIHNRTDDSVAMVVNNKSRLIRRSRSYVPSPVHLNLYAEGIFAAGAELVNCFAIGKGNQAIVSQHIGDLKNLETFDFYSESVDRMQRLFRFKPQLAVCDMHPDYLSTNFAQELNIPLVQVQHHHAHIASCMAEHKLDEKVIGISFDGTGYGTDGQIWGGEFFICDLNDFERISHFEYIPQPGGDIVTKQPWRMALSYLMYYFESDITHKYEHIFKGVSTHDFELVKTMIKKRINCPLTSSAGRLFDAVSALLDICKKASYHAEPPMRLESVAIETTESYPFEINGVISFKKTFNEILNDLAKGIDTGLISGKFHNTIVQLIVKVAIITREETAINSVVLSGGSFQNRILLKKAEDSLKDANFAVFSQSAIPSNDGGIALGQLAIAAKRRELGII
jgi:hydrogenase maturation protein HypF